MDPDAEKGAARTTTTAADTHMDANQRSPTRLSPAIPTALSAALSAVPTTFTTPPATNKRKQPCQQHKRGQRQGPRRQRVRERTRERAGQGGEGVMRREGVAAMAGTPTSQATTRGEAAMGENTTEAAATTAHRPAMAHMARPRRSRRGGWRF